MTYFRSMSIHSLRQKLNMTIKFDKSVVDLKESIIRCVRTYRLVRMFVKSDVNNKAL